MRKIASIWFILVALGIVMPTTKAAAAPLAYDSCAVYEVRLLNDVDSGFGGWWAMDTIQRDVTVCQTGPNEYTATYADVGKFMSFAGASPDNTGLIGDGIYGSIRGGMSLIVNGTINPATPLDMGTVDLMCDHSGNCASSFSTLGTIFATIDSYTYVDWGWTYTTSASCVKPTQTWVNAASGSSGDIVAASCR